MPFIHSSFELAGLIDARPWEAEWAFLMRSGTLLLDRPVSLDLAGLSGPLELHLSPEGEYAAVVERFGQFGRVFHLPTGQMIFSLDRGDYHPEVSVFPAAFTTQKGRTLLVHGSDWNRLEITAFPSGENVTARGPTYDDRGALPNYLDYFHAGLSISPGNDWIADDGWLWHPVGEIRVWSISAWLQNPWESENGPTVLSPCYRGVYRWDLPLCWTDENTLAVWGSAEPDRQFDDDAQSAIRLFNVATGEETQRLSGPKSMPDDVWPRRSARHSWMVFDRWLFLIQPSTGTEVHDLTTGNLIHAESGFSPRRYHERRGEFLSWNEEGASVARWTDEGLYRSAIES